MAYFDILGYSDLVKDACAAGTQSQMLAKLYDALNTGRDWLEERLPEEETYKEAFNRAFQKDRYTLKAFTDNIVIGWPISDDAES